MMMSVGQEDGMVRVPAEGAVLAGVRAVVDGVGGVGGLVVSSAERKS